MAIAIPSDNPANLKKIEDLSRKGVRIVLADFKTPLGNYTSQVLTKIESSWGDRESKYYQNPEIEKYKSKVYANVVTFEANAHQVITKVMEGFADAGLVYFSDVAVKGAKLHTGTPAGVRVQKGNKQVDLIRQSRLLSPENRQLLEDRLAGKEKFHPERGWEINPDTLGAKTEMYNQMVASNEIPEETIDEELQPKRIAAANGVDLLQDDQSPAQDEQAAGQAVPPMLQRAEPAANIPGVSDVVSAAMPTKEQFEQNAQDYQQKFNAFKAQHEQAGTTSTIGGSAATRAQMDMDDCRALKAAELANPNSLSAMENRRLAQLKQVAEPQQQVQPGTRGLATQPEDSGN